MSRAIAGMYTEDEECERLSIKKRTLRAWRAKGYGPTPTYIGRFVYYSPEHEREFLEAGARPFPKPASSSRVRRTG